MGLTPICQWLTHFLKDRWQHVKLVKDVPDTWTIRPPGVHVPFSAAQLTFSPWTWTPWATSLRLRRLQSTQTRTLSHENNFFAASVGLLNTNYYWHVLTLYYSHSIMLLAPAESLHSFYYLHSPTPTISVIWLLALLSSNQGHFIRKILYIWIRIYILIWLFYFF